ncbi:MAG TPA: DUF6443 domain-containing protein, partial [Sphingobacteriaceae bacterium]
MMNHNKILKRVLLTYLVVTACLANAYAQNGVYNIAPVNGKYHYTASETPDKLVPYLVTSIGSYQWESCDSPNGTFAPIGTNQEYIFNAPLTKTMYFRCRYQMLPGFTPVYSNLVKLSLVSDDWEDLNYVRRHDVMVAGITTWQAVDNLPIGQKLETTTYLDGLGRNIQEISKETATPSASNPNLWGDITTFSAFDAFGRESKNYLPYTTTGSMGKYKPTAASDQQEYYTAVYNETSPFSATSFDNSPLNRVLNIKLAGTSWAASSGKTMAYEINDITENVQNFSIGYTSGATPISLGAYAGNTLYKSLYTDENGKKVIEYSNKAGQLILKKVQLDDAPTVAHTGWICTYNIYDDFGLLRYVIQPEAVKYLDANGWSFSGTNGTQVLNELCSRYEYDDKQRNVVKKSPGAEELYLLYDQRDRVVFMQDGNQRAKTVPEWTANLYDDLDRLTVITLYQTSKTRTQLAADIANAAVSSIITINNPTAAINDLIIDKREVGTTNYAARTNIEIVAGFESEATGDFVVEINATAVSQPVNVTTTTYKNPIGSADLNNPSISTVVKYLFYDNYNYSEAKAFRTDFDNALAYTTGDPIATTSRTFNMATGSMVRVLGTETFLTTTYHYDEKGRSIQILEDNIKSGQDITTMQYQFDGRLLSTNTKHTAAGSDYYGYSIVTKNVFDKIGRVTSIEKK